jgi:hypothetical protein
MSYTKYFSASLLILLTFTFGCSEATNTPHKFSEETPDSPTIEALQGAKTSDRGKADSMADAFTHWEERSLDVVLLRDEPANSLYTLMINNAGVDFSHPGGWTYAESDRILCGTPEAWDAESIRCMFKPSSATDHGSVDNGLVGEFQGNIAANIATWQNESAETPFTCSLVPAPEGDLDDGGSRVFRCKVKGSLSKTRANVVLGRVHIQSEDSLGRIINDEAARNIVEYRQDEPIESIEELRRIEHVTSSTVDVLLAPGVQTGRFMTWQQGSRKQVVLRDNAAFSFYNLMQMQTGVERGDIHHWSYTRGSNYSCGTADNWSSVVCVFSAPEANDLLSGPQADSTNGLAGDFTGSVAASLQSAVSSVNSVDGRNHNAFECKLTQAPNEGIEDRSIQCMVRDQVFGVWDRTERANAMLDFVQTAPFAELVNVIGSEKTADNIINYIHNDTGQERQLESLRELANIDRVTENVFEKLRTRVTRTEQ